ncbi:MAG: hypothetical protein CMO80_01945 [Verrucomicrobiales bacterium]|nr:hypothetical protein [Verrucomicrobiales bacterium]|tara:strand:+ start:1706 stop:2404 length:699 start_codon:yes stop_codon:yes gene_type:complete
MQKSSKQAVLGFLGGQTFKSGLDCPSGNGWLAHSLAKEKTDLELDGVDLYVDEAEGYRKIWQADLDDGLPDEAGKYDLICCCEGIEHVGNLLGLLRSCRKHLNEDGLLIVTTPNVWFPQARLQYFLRGFFPSPPPLGDKIKPGTHIYITPWSYPQLYVYLKLAGFDVPEIISEPLSRPKHFHERLLGIPGKFYSRRKVRKAMTDEERRYWQITSQNELLYGRHLIVYSRPVT